MSLTAECYTATSPIPPTPWSGDEVIQLRAWASEHIYPLDTDLRAPLLIGTASSCAIRVHDAAGFASREHAYLEWDGRHWCIIDRSKNGLSLDGERVGRAILAPGMRIGLGPGVTLIADSARTIKIRAALARMRGWSFELAYERERALQNLRMAVAGKAVFTLCGEEELTAFAQELHQLAMGEQHPIVFCSTAGRQRFALGTIKRVSKGREAIRLARGGTILLDNRRLPSDLVEMLGLLLEARSNFHTLVIVLGKYVRKTDIFTSTPFVIPLLSARQPEIERLRTECEMVAAERLDIEPLDLTAAQRRWIQENCSTLSDFQTSILRLVAIKHAGSAYAAARRLGLTPSGLQQWIAARGIPED
jgi:hypothetical protein